VRRGEVWWAELPEPTGSEPGYRRPVVVLQSDPFNRSRIATVVTAAVTSNTRLAEAPGNVHLSRRSMGLDRESVVNVSQIITLDKQVLVERVGRIPAAKMREVDEGVRLVLAL